MHLPVFKLSGVVCWLRKEEVLLMLQVPQLQDPFELLSCEEGVREPFFKSNWTKDSTFLVVYLASKSFQILIENFDRSIGR